MHSKRTSRFTREFKCLSALGKAIFLLNAVLVTYLAYVLIFYIWNFYSYFIGPGFFARPPFFLEMVVAHALLCLILTFWLLIAYRSEVRVLGTPKTLLFNFIPLLMILLFSVAYLASR